MAPLNCIPRPLPKIVGFLLCGRPVGRDAVGGPVAGRQGALPPAAVTEERLVGWKTDPEITAHLTALTSLDLGRDDIVLNKVGHMDWRDRNDELAPFHTAGEEWFSENNLAHLLEHTPGLKSLNVRTNVHLSRWTRLENPCFGLTHTHPCMLKLQMGSSLCDARMQKQVIRACIVRMPSSLTTSALGRSGGDHKAV
jgi:hypothetical protein